MTMLTPSVDDFDAEAWLATHRLPMEFSGERIASLKRWLEHQGFIGVNLRYKARYDKFRLWMRPGTASNCKRDEEAEEWVREGARACGAEVEALIALRTQDNRILATFRLSLPQPASA